MAQILIESISDADHLRIHDALTAEYNVETCKEAITEMIKQKVRDIEEMKAISASMESLADLEL